MALDSGEESMTSLKRLISAAGLILLGSAAAVPVWAQSYPNRPIHLVTGNPPGGATDVIARTLAQPLSMRLGQNVIVDNRPGANGNISAEVVAKAAPDGYNILYANSSLLVINPHIYRKSGVNPIRDLLPVGTTITNQLVLAVNPTAVPVKTFPEFIDFARQHGKDMFYASIGNGSYHHLGMELLKQMAKIEITHVPYKGGGPASISVIAGDNAAMFGGTSVVYHIKNRKLSALAVSERKGWPAMPDLPAIGEFLPGYSMALWHGIFAPRGTPPAIVEKLRTELNAVLTMSDVKKRLETSGAGQPYVTTPGEFDALIKSDYERYSKIIQSIGLKVD
jgi:tripartite-type tricarboxylate transporter receptor subunit TctC